MVVNLSTTQGLSAFKIRRARGLGVDMAFMDSPRTEKECKIQIKKFAPKPVLINVFHKDSLPNVRQQTASILGLLPQSILAQVSSLPCSALTAVSITRDSTLDIVRATGFRTSLNEAVYMKTSISTAGSRNTRRKKWNVRVLSRKAEPQVFKLTHQA